MNRYENYGPTLLRIALGIVFLVHSAYLKLVVFTLPGTVGFFQSLGLPGSAAYATIAAEIVGGIMLLLGWRVREAAAALVVVSLGATWAHAGNGWLFTNTGGGWEYPLLLAVTSAVLVLTGPGAFALQVPHRAKVLWRGQTRTASS